MSESTGRCNLCHASDALLSTRWHKDGFEIVECARCELVFRQDLPTRSDVAAIYQHDYFQASDYIEDGQGYLDYLADADQHRLNARARLRWLARQRTSGRLLDVGCAAGFFMDEARTQGWAVSGIDIAPTMSSWGREHLGLEIATGLFQDLDAASNSVDCVCMWDYIEHSIDPLADLEKAYDALRPGGILTLSTGDIASAVARISGRHWHLLTPRHHNFFFSARTLTSALLSAGFTDVSLSRPGAKYSVEYLAHKLLTLANVAPIRRLAVGVSASSAAGVALPMNLWDIVTAVAHKPGACDL